MSAAPKGDIDSAAVTASLKRCPDTKQGVSAVLWAALLLSMILCYWDAGFLCTGGLCSAGAGLAFSSLPFSITIMNGLEV